MRRLASSLRTIALSVTAEYRTENASESTAGQAATNSGSTEPADHRAEDAAKATLMPARASRHVTGNQHRKDRQHLL